MFRDIFNGMDWDMIGIGGIIVFAIEFLIIVGIFISIIVIFHKVKAVEIEIHKIENEVSRYINELIDSENEQLELEEKEHQDMIISSVLKDYFSQEV